MLDLNDPLWNKLDTMFRNEHVPQGRWIVRI
jgi:hypothetical protein